MSDEKNDAELVSEREKALTELSVRKCREMDLRNHLTAYNALQELPEPHKANLKRMGYSVWNMITPVQLQFQMITTKQYILTLTNKTESTAQLLDSPFWSR